ncbi:MAG: CBS domain-containing protein [Gammaproteobacteria bacterium]|nr:CBS domain-containing protein [Gammaproteobacteria bacterium]
MNSLSFTKCHNVAQVDWPTQNPELNLQTKAVKLVTDFKVHRPLIIDCNTKAVEAEYSMKKTHVKLKIVLDSANNFLGTVSFNDLNNQEIIKKVAAGDNRTDLKVSDFMRSKEQLLALDWHQLETTSLRTLLQFMSNSDEQHVLVTDCDGENLRGIISASDIARALHVDVNLAKPVSFKLIHNEVLPASQFAA